MRIFLLIVTNLAVMLLLSVAISVAQATGYLPQGQWTQLLAIAAIFGFGGSFISLLASKFIAKWTMRVRVIDKPPNATEAWLVDTVKRQAERAGIGMPEVGIFDSPDPNAFATGPTKNNSLVAVSTGLLHIMDKPQVEAVLGHEISHVANGDMVTLTLLQGVLNTFVFFLARVIGTLVDGGNRDRGRGMGYFFVVMAAQVVLGMGASIIVAWFSRRREFRADAGGGALTSNMDMANALRALQKVHTPGMMPSNMAAFGIRPSGGMMRLFMSHPPTEERIAALMSGVPQVSPFGR